MEVITDGLRLRALLPTGYGVGRARVGARTTRLDFTASCRSAAAAGGSIPMVLEIPGWGSYSASIAVS